MSMNIETVEQLVEYRTVQIWLKGVRLQSPASTTPDEVRLSTLFMFCKLVEKEPDAIIEECFRPQQEGDEWKHIKFKVRRRYVALISQAEAELYGGGTVGRHHGRIIMSFFIHNGVSMQAVPLR
jgi:hypothetical protein